MKCAPSARFEGVVWLSESFYVATAVRVAYDIAAGLGDCRLRRELDYTQPEVAPTLPVSL